MSNPFRKTEPPTSSNHVNNHVAYQQSLPLTDASNSSRGDVRQKIPKKVRVQSPPPSSPSPSAPNSASRIGGIFVNPMTTTTTVITDPCGSSSDSETRKYDGAYQGSNAPLNPFSRTLETMEHTGTEGPADIISLSASGKPTMDVNAFQRLLMTGDAGLGSPHTTSPRLSQPPIQLHTQTPSSKFGAEEHGSSTDTSSMSRQSKFEHIQPTTHESPRTSHEVSDDDIRRGVEQTSTSSGRKPPPPPSSRHGKLIKVELRDDASSNAPTLSPQPPTPSSITPQHHFTSSPVSSRSTTDLNKPLPPAPSRASHDSDRESVFDKESAGKTPELPSSASSVRRKVPPAPPISRRHSHLITDAKSTRESSRPFPKVEEEGGDDSSFSRRRSIAILGLDSPGTSKPPPPPPTRKVGSVRRSNRDSQQPGLDSSSTVSLPPPTPPARHSSRSISGGGATGRPASVRSFDMSTNKRTSMAPPPPPSRHHRNSMDSDVPNLGGAEGRRMSQDSVMSLKPAPPPDSKVEVGGADILADIAKLQLEIEAAAKGQSNAG
ncbi:hypothetical protein BJ878DRAFT_90568 [Calycina marina]|uniref:Uncharacterized protein n=1 Tax=Calycina marina TaxID=1763456 RepID=A0A9P7ZBR6_9HELO|nr:hypothetical protein BJ878DRAFT_90568 [Calycina marina]